MKYLRATAYPFLFLPIILLLLFTGCKEEEVQTPLNTEKELLSFKLESARNPQLKDGDIAGEISGTVIALEIPEDVDISSLIATFTHSGVKVLVGDKEQVSGKTPNNFSSPLTYRVVAEDESVQEYRVIVTLTPVIVPEVIAIPCIRVETEGRKPIVEKKTYLPATIVIEANGWGDDYEGTTQIRGRGNSTWEMPKKPYRLKLDKKSVILGLGEERDWILLANYIDPTLMLNAVAFKIGQLLELPFTNHAIPVDLYLNGEYAGNYMLTEQVELSSTRVNIDKKEGILLEIDTNFDEDFQFKSTHYKLPVMVKDPDIKSEEHFQRVKDEFHQLEAAIASDQFPNTRYKEYLDVESLVKYFIVYNLTHNMEINHPKSIYIHKDKGGKYTMGPIWDFDWAYDYEGKGVHFGSHERPFLTNKNFPAPALGYTFFNRFFEDPAFVALYKETWRRFHAEKKTELMEYVDWYAKQVTESQKKDQEKWQKGTTNYGYKIRQLKSWLEGRFTFIDAETNALK